MATYPNLPESFETRMRAVSLAAAAEDDVESWLGGAGCPYSEEAKKLLRKMLGSGSGSGSGGGGSGEGGSGNRGGDGAEIENVFGGLKDIDKFDVLLGEVEATISEMRELERAMRGEDDPAARVAVLKAKTTLLEKWTSLKSSVFSMREMAEFQGIILEVLDKVLSVDQRGEVMSMLRNLKSVG